ncbi:MAG: hypothetical protein WB392_11760, partial [Methanotrichaceae archaeon]
MERILVISTKAGLGHIKVAQALEEYVNSNLPNFKIDHVDFCEIEPMLGKFFEIFYEIANNRLPTA